MKKRVCLFIAFLAISVLFLQPTLANGPDVQWEKTFGGSNHDYGHSCQQTSDGGYIITGETMSFGAGYYDVYLLKTDPNGNLIWQKTFGGSSNDSGKAVRQTSDGGYIVAGTCSFGAGMEDVYLVKTDPNGNMLWQKTFGGELTDNGHSCQQTADGGYIITGSTHSFDAQAADVYLVKTDQNGNMQWQNLLSGIISESDIGYSVQQTTDGGYIITGWNYAFDAEAGFWSPDVYLIKTNSSGNKIWEKNFG